MRVLFSKDAGDSSGAKRPFEGFLRSRPKRPQGEDNAESEQSAEGSEVADGSSDEQPFGFYRPDPEDVERDRVARRLWKQVFD
ncbi:MAG: hypothetical protein QOH93_467 [Chloroflexia bacterium]|jgi:hypothetical protein|nr:hypothetical protein [Chloroflexia bacterium]